MNCGSCTNNIDCEYVSFKKCVESDLYHGDMTEIFTLVCSKYTHRKNEDLESVQVSTDKS